MKDADSIIETTKDFVKKTLTDAEGGHDWFHIERVFNNAMSISDTEKVDRLVVSLAALLHDIADRKFYNGDDSIGPRKAKEFLKQQFIPDSHIDHIVGIISNMSFHRSLDGPSNFKSKELDVVQDADRLDAIGAIGIARCFNYGGFKNRTLYDPEIKPNLSMSSKEYKNSKAPTINHFYEKLLLLKDQMKTETGKRMAQKRHEFMELYLENFFEEWNAEE